MKPDLRTPAGASVYIRRTRWHSRITIDRWPIADATEAQCNAVYDLFVREYTDQIANTRSQHRNGIAFLAQPSIWEGTVRREREADVLEALYRIEAQPTGPVLMTFTDEPRTTDPKSPARAAHRERRRRPKRR
ncbi:hypothetical protein ACQXVK_10190 [Curtobacterium sp. AB451]|uniref:hypothetical protein n=1 Tax=Curtobacterium sp. AB451 TaxID=3422306 RepID=UPI003D327136